MAVAVAPRLDRAERRLQATEPPPDRPDLSLAEFIPATSRMFSAPRHLADLIALLEEAEHAPVRRVVSLPPQHGKTETVLHGLAWLLKRTPTRTHAYATYSARQARSKAYRFRQIARDAWIAASDMANLDEWRTAEGGGLLATSVEGPLTGQGIDGLLLIDDPIKDRMEAESWARREQVWGWWQNVARTRLHPSASVLVVMTRWHEDDLAGRLIAAGWQTLRLPALSDDGMPLWPEQFPLEFVQQTRADVGEYTWASLYQGQPRPKGGMVFHDAHFYDALPDAGYRAGIGADFAYTARTHADYSVAVLGRLLGDTLYVESVARHQVEAPQFGAVLQQMQQESGAQVTAFVSGTERGTVDFMVRSQSLRIRAEAAVADKFVRAQPVAAAWNAGRVLLPRSAPWLDAFVGEVCGFTGVGDLHDDQVDALAGLHHQLLGGRPIRSVQAY